MLRLPRYLILLIGAFLWQSGLAHALPAFAKFYNTPCSTCHTLVPSLNANGRAFQANYFHQWGRGALGVAVQVTESRESTQGLAGTRTSSSRELITAAGFGRYPGGIYLDATGNRGYLKEAYLALPVTQQLALVLGQTSALRYQFTQATSQTTTLPGALSASAAGFAFTDLKPNLHFDWFDHRGQETDNGNYLSLGLPFNGTLKLATSSPIGTGFGLSLHGFQRRGATTMGLFHYQNDSDTRSGLLFTQTLTPKLELLAAESIGHDSGLWVPRSTLDLSYQPVPQLSLIGRWEATSSGSYPFFGLSLTPSHTSLLRVNIESSQQKGQHVTTLTTQLTI